MAISPEDAARTERRRAQRAQRAATTRRRLLALAAIAVAAAVGGAIVGAGGDGENGQDGSQAAAPPPSCPPRIADDPRRLAGQMLIVRMDATATEGLRRGVRRGTIGGVILFPPAGTRPSALGREIASLRDAARRTGLPQPLVMIDQEGGEVKRLPTLPPDRPPARIAAGGEAAFEQGRDTGAALAAIGIDVDLAPVLDVPTSADAFIASRAFASDPSEVARAGVAFGEGLQAAGVAATAKHFPGLGTATVNTDLAPSTIEATRAELRSGLEPFRAAIAEGFDLVMVANAGYPAYDPERVASQSPRVIDGLLRRRLRFEGVVITDDLGAQALVQAGLDEAEAAVGAARAGADLLLFAQSAGGAARDALVRALGRGALDRETLIDACARISALRERP